MIIDVTDMLRDIIEHIDYDAITVAEIKQKLEIALEELEKIESELDDFGEENHIGDDLPY
jgi:hypothetical protein